MMRIRKSIIITVMIAAAALVDLRVRRKSFICGICANFRENSSGSKPV